MTKRLNWIDVSRGIAFLMVIYSHLEYKNDFLMHFFSPIFLTTFFFVSGYLYKEGIGFKQVLEQRTRTLLLPLFILGGGMIALNQIVTFNETIPLIDRIKGLLYQNGQNQILWFIAALYVYSLLFYWVEYWSSTTEKLLIVSLTLFILNVIYSIWWDGPQMPWHVNGAGFGCFYMGLGKAYKYYESKIDAWMSRNMLFLCLIIYVVLLWFYNIDISFSGSRYIVDSLLITSLGLLVCVYLSKLIVSHNRLLLFVGSNTLFYFAFHGKAYSLLQTVTGRFLTMVDMEHSCMLDFCIGISITFMDALILIPFAMFVNKYIPQILGKGFKLWR